MKCRLLNGNLSYWLRRASNQASHGLGLELGACGVTGTGWVVLAKLVEVAPATLTQIAAAMGMTHGGASKLLGRLVNKGLSRIEIDDDDGRCNVVTLTPKAEALLPSLVQLAREHDERFLKVLGVEERGALLGLLHKLVEA